MVRERPVSVGKSLGLMICSVLLGLIDMIKSPDIGFDRRAPFMFIPYQLAFLFYCQARTIIFVVGYFFLCGLAVYGFL